MYGLVSVQCTLVQLQQLQKKLYLVWALSTTIPVVEWYAVIFASEQRHGCSSSRYFDKLIM